jgi:hypothetical protein
MQRPIKLGAIHAVWPGGYYDLTNFDSAYSHLILGP